MLPNHNDNKKKGKTLYMLTGPCHRTMFSLLSLSRSLGTGWEHLCGGVETCFQQPPAAAGAHALRAGEGELGGDKVGPGESAWSGCCPHHCPSRCPHWCLSCCPHCCPHHCPLLPIPLPTLLPVALPILLLVPLPALLPVLLPIPLPAPLPQHQADWGGSLGTGLCRLR